MKKSAWFSFKNKDSPDYVSSYGDTYTDRQLAILNNEIPLYEIRPNELSILYKKAKQKNDVDSYEIAIQMYAEKTKPQEYIPQYTIEEAKAILQELTPWIINWEKKKCRPQHVKCFDFEVGTVLYFLRISIALRL